MIIIMILLINVYMPPGASRSGSGRRGLPAPSGLISLTQIIQHQSIELILQGGGWDMYFFLNNHFFKTNNNINIPICIIRRPRLQAAAADEELQLPLRQRHEPPQRIRFFVLVFFQSVDNFFVLVLF